jgi:hypothetical protein
MSLPAKLFLDQRDAERLPLVVGATLRDIERRPYDVRIDDLSQTGCHVTTLLGLPLQEVVTVGIPGIGMHEARLIRETAGGYGCEFIRNLAAADVQKALRANVVVPTLTPAFQDRGPESVQRLTPPGLIGAAIVTAAIAPWIFIAWLIW